MSLSRFCDKIYLNFCKCCGLFEFRSDLLYFLAYKSILLSGNTVESTDVEYNILENEEMVKHQ